MAEETETKKQAGEIKHYPKPTYSKCNAGHELVEVYNERRNEYVWDCPTCIRRMQEV